MVACRTDDGTILGKLAISGKTGLFSIVGLAKGNNPSDRLPIPLLPGHAAARASQLCNNYWQADDHLNPALAAEQRYISRGAGAALPPRLRTENAIELPLRRSMDL